MLKTKYKRIRFKDVSKALEFRKRKTKVYYCYNEADQHLGTIKWYSPWRKYCFFPKYDQWTLLIFSGGCLIDTGHFCVQLMEQRQEAKKSAKAVKVSAQIQGGYTSLPNNKQRFNNKD